MNALTRKLEHKLESYTIDKQKTYIIPSADGFKFVFINFTLFLIALSYANNMALIITFAMVSYLILEMLDTHKLISDTNIKKVQAFDHFQNEATPLICHVDSKLDINELRYLSLSLKEVGNSHLNCESSYDIKEQKLFFNFPSMSRGRYSFSRIKLFTYGRSKLFYVWKYFPVKEEVFIYPTKKNYPVNRYGADDQKISYQNDTEFSHHIRYHQGLSSKRIDWKIFAKTDQLYWKKFQSNIDDVIEINYNSFTEDKEERLKYMSYLIDKYFKQGTSWKLVLPGKILTANSGHQHYKSSLEAISEL